MDYPRTLTLASFIILTISILGTLAIAVVVPQSEINLLSGLIQAFKVFFAHFDLNWAVPMIMASLALIGSLAGINIWTIGLAKGLLITAEYGFFTFYFEEDRSLRSSSGDVGFLGYHWNTFIFGFFVDGQP